MTQPIGVPVVLLKYSLPIMEIR